MKLRKYQAKTNTKISIPKHVTLKLQKTKNKEKNIERSQEKKTKHFTYRGTMMRIMLDFSSVTMQIRGLSEIFQVLKEKTTNLEFVIREIILQK